MSNALSAKDVSVVVCSLNAERSIAQSLRSARDSGVLELVVVDGGSVDRTVAIAEAYADQVLVDDGTGLGAARAIGVSATTGALVLNLGVDNVLPSGSLQAMVDCLVASQALGVSALTRIRGDAYVDRCLDLYRRLRFPAGPASTIGTPTLFWGDRLRVNGFDPAARFSDDAELCERWIEHYGGRFRICQVEIDEIGQNSIGAVVARWKMYGTSDHEVYRRRQLAGWGIRRRVKSLTHPFRVELVQPVKAAHGWQRLWLFPFLLLVTAVRYWGWVAASFERSRRGT